MTDERTNEQTSVNVESLLRLKILMLDFWTKYSSNIQNSTSGEAANFQGKVPVIMNNDENA